MSKNIIGAIVGVALVAVGVLTANPMLIVQGAVMVGTSVVSMLTPKPKVNKEAANRLNATFVTTEPRKMVFGTTALPTDVRYQTFTGTSQEFFHQVIACAGHTVDAISEIWIDNEKAWTVGGGVLGRFSGYLTVQIKLVGVTGSGFAIDGVWGTSASLTGCAHIWLKYKTTGASKSTDSPFSGGVSPRLTIRGNGALVYDPRLDSTVTGGSGSQRVNDQTTWAFASSGRNPALQLLWYLLGWKIGAKLSVGRGIPPARLDLPSFITAANICDETVSLAAGGTEPRYRADGAFSEGDDASVVISNLLASMAGTLRDNGGKIALTIFKNDLAAPAASFTEADIIGEESWEQTGSLDKMFNVVRGHYIDASDNALYQPVDFPEVPLSTGPVDGIYRIDTVEFSNVQSASQAQRLAKQRLQRAQYQGRYSAKLGARAWQVSLGDPVQFSHQGLGWSNKLFRVLGQSINANGVVNMVLQEENAAIYAWAAEDNAPVVAGTPTVYDPQNSPIIAGVLAAGTTADWPSVTDPSGTKPENNATRTGQDRAINRNSDFVLWDSGSLAIAWATVAYSRPGTVTRRSNSTNSTRGTDNFGVAGGTSRYGDTVPVSVGEVWWVEGRYITTTNGSGTPTWFVGADGIDVGGGPTAGYYTDGTTAGIGGPISLFVAGGAKSFKFKITVPSGTVGLRPLVLFDGTGALGEVDYLALYRDEPGSTNGSIVGSNTFDTDGVTPIPKVNLTNDSITINGSGQITNTGASGVVSYISNNVFGITSGKLLRYAGDTGLTSIVDNSYVVVSSGRLSVDGGSTLGTRVDNNHVVVTGAGDLSVDNGTTALARVDNTKITMANTGVLSGGGTSSRVDALQILNAAAEAGSDKTSNQQVTATWTVTSVVLTATAGTLNSSQFPRDLPRPVVVKGGTNVQGDNLTTYSVTNISSNLTGAVTVDNTNGSTSKGQVSISSSATGAGSFKLVVAYNGVTIATFSVAVTVESATPSSGGGSGSTTGDFAVSGSVNGTDVVLGTTTVVVASGKTLTCDFAPSFYCVGISKSTSLACRFQYSVAGAGSWSNVGSNVSGSGSTDASSEPTPGSIYVHQTVAPSANTYDVRLLGTSGGSAVPRFDDIYTAYVSAA